MNKKTILSGILCAALGVVGCGYYEKGPNGEWRARYALGPNGEWVLQSELEKQKVVRGTIVHEKTDFRGVVVVTGNNFYLDQTLAMYFFHLREKINGRDVVRVDGYWCTGSPDYIKKLNNLLNPGDNIVMNVLDEKKTKFQITAINDNTHVLEGIVVETTATQLLPTKNVGHTAQ